MSGHRQCGKHLKRRKSWHRGRGEARRWAAVMRRWPREQTPRTIQRDGVR